MNSEMSEPMGQLANAPPEGLVPYPRPTEIPYERRKQLLALAERIGEVVVAETQPHERCLLRTLVESLVT